MQTRVAILAVVLATILAGCGSSDSTDCIPGTPTALFPDRCTSSGTSGSGDTAVGSPTLALALTNSSGASITQVAPDQAGVLKASVKNASGAAVANAVVTFTTTDSSAALVPSSGTALTDASGVAQVGLPAGTQNGAFTVTANATVSGTAAKGTVNYTVAFPTLTLSALSINPATLSSGGNASVGVTVSSGGSPYAPTLAVSFASPCVAAGKATMGSPVMTQSGVATASYVDKGCGVADVITASVTLGGATVTQTGTITVLPASAGSIKFVSANTTTIALKGTGGVGRQEFSTLTFTVYDTTGNVVAGKLIDFVFADSNSATTVGGLTLNPSSATSAADGTVTTLVTAGTIPTSVRVVASVRGSSPLLTTLSNVLVISSGVPDQRHFSLATSVGNCEGWDYVQPCSTVTVVLGDHFGNTVPDGTAVNFTTEGGVIEPSCLTAAGTCSVQLWSGNPRPTSGRVTVLAYALGEEDFIDRNNNNVFDPGVDTLFDDTNGNNVFEPPGETSFDKSPDIFRDDNEDGNLSPGEPCIGPNSNGDCKTPGDNQYNGVLRIPQVPSAQSLYVWSHLVQTFSGSFANISSAPIVCTTNSTLDVPVQITDQRGNSMPADTSIAFEVSSDLATVAPDGYTVRNFVGDVGGLLPAPTSYLVAVGCGLQAGSASLVVTVTTPNGDISTASLPITINP